MLDIGEERWEFVVKQVEALMIGNYAHGVALNVYQFATRDDTDVSTLAVSSQIVRELRKREREGVEPTHEAKGFIEGYDRSRKEGRSISLKPVRPVVQGPMMFSGYTPHFVKPQQLEARGGRHLSLTPQKYFPSVD